MKCDLCDRKLHKKEKRYALEIRVPHRNTLLNFCEFCWINRQKKDPAWIQAMHKKLAG